MQLVYVPQGHRFTISYMWIYQGTLLIDEYITQGN